MALRIIEGAGQVTAADFGEGPNAGDVTWNQLVVIGKWDGHWQGPFEVTAKDISQMEQSVGASAVEIPVDYGHATLFDREAPAAGWVRAAQQRDINWQPALFGQIAWTPRAAKAIREGEYRYLSPTIQWRSTDRITGKMGGTALHSVALTNKPFLHELPEVRLNSIRVAMRQLEENPMNEETRKKFALALGMPESATVDEIQAKIAALAASDRETVALFATMGVKSTVEAGRKIAMLQAENTRKPELSEVETLRAENERLKKAETLRAAMAAIAKAQEERKVKGGTIDPKTGEPTADSTENFRANWAFVLRDPEGFGAYMATLEPIAPTTVEHAPVTMSDGKPGTNAFQAAYNKALSKIRSNPDRLEVIRLMGSTPEETAQIEAENGIIS